MDNLNSLFEKKEYELILSLTELSKDPKELLMRVSCLTILGKTDKALDEIEKNQSIIEKEYQPNLMKLHFELLLSKKLFDEAKIALQHYENLPYVSQEVEEFMREIKERIIDESRPKNNKTIGIEDIYEVLEKETDQSKISQVLFSLKNFNINIYIDSLKIFLKRKDIHPNFRTYGLILLIDEKYNEEIDYLLNDELIKINPSKLVPPFGTDNFTNTAKSITNIANKNVSLIEISLQLLNFYIMDTYPEDIYQDGTEILAKAFIYIGKQYLGENSIIEEKNVVELANKIRKIIESTPEIKL